MANWVKNKVKFSDKGKEILDKVIVANLEKEELEEDVLFDFNKVVPMPKSLNITSGGYSIKAMQYSLLNTDIKKLEKTLKKLKEIKANFYGNYFFKNI